MCGEFIYSASCAPSSLRVWGSALGSVCDPPTARGGIKAVFQTLTVPQGSIDFNKNCREAGKGRAHTWDSCSLGVP